MNRPVRHIILFSISCLFAGLLLSFSWKRAAEGICEDFKVEIKGNGVSHFVTVESAREIILNLGDPLIGTAMDLIDIPRIEARLMEIPYVKEAIVYKTIDKTLRVSITQREPILRLIDKNGQSAYLDKDGLLMETSESYTERCIPLTGSYTLDQVEVFMQPEGKLYRLKDFIEFINGSEFWSAQIVQIDLPADGQMTLLPRVGVHEIVIGSLTDYEVKMKNLKDFYDKGITQTNWNLYKSLDIRFKDQVVCLKR